jgi:hypothetical protein
MAFRTEGHLAPEANAYAQLLEAEEQKFTRRGGRPVLLATPGGRAVAVVDDPGPLLAGLRAGEPVEVDDWRLPTEVQGGPVRGVRVVVYPDGLVKDVG